MCRKFFCQFVLLLCLLQPSLAQDLVSPDFELVLHPEAKVVSRFDSLYNTRMVVELEGQRVRINWSENNVLLLFPEDTIRLQTSDNSQGRIIKAFVDGEKYEVKKLTREIAWLLPGQEVFFRTRAGKVTQAVASNDFLKVRRDTPSGRVALESSVGTTDALLDKEGKLEVFDGPEVTDHIYFVRGLAFERGPVTLRIPLPKGPFYDGMPKERYLVFKKEVEAEEESVDTVTDSNPTPAKKRDPLRAAPATWGSPELDARSGENKDDPLNVRREKRVKHPQDPLKARTGENSEELLRVKDY